MSVNFNLINLDPQNQEDKLLFQKKKNSPLVSIEDGDSDAPLRAYDTFRFDKDIKYILTDSNEFRMILYKNGTAEITKARGNL